MDLRESPAQRELRRELRAYFAALLPEEKRRVAGEEGVGGEHFRDIVRLLGKDGWLGIGWPVEYGGQGRSIEDQFVFFDEVQRAGLPFPFVTVNTVGPTLMKYGTEEQKARFLPGILAGDIVFAIGYTEPEAGTDLASLQTRAVRDGDTWVVDGNKVFTSGANTADYVWLACRTDANAPKHKGISILIVPTDDPGFSWSPIHTVGGLTVTSTYYSGVRVGDQDVVGDVHGGWQLITAQLNHERIGLAALGRTHARAVAPGPRLGPGDRCPRHPVGADGFRAHSREARGDATVELEDDRGRSAGCVVWGGRRCHQDVRHRNPCRGLSHAARDPRRRRAAASGLTGRDPRRSDRTDLPAERGQHVRRRRQRGAPRHGGHPRPRTRP